jgi:acyl-CoA reductase-like NAD-dependent aldehyde dehydrogenase
MNDSSYGLTASVWTNAAANPESEKAFLDIMNQIDAGTIFLNRCMDFANDLHAYLTMK